MKRRALTLIEILVVIAIIGVMIGLLLPAVQRARESANYIKCRSQLRQIGLAIHNYEAQTGQLPGAGSTAHQNSVLTTILPYLELDNLRQLIQHDQPLFLPYGGIQVVNPAQAQAVGSVVRPFLCASENFEPNYADFHQVRMAGGSYVANAGSGTGTNYDFRYPTDGVFWFGSKLRFKDIQDGISSTLFFSEALMGAGTDTLTVSINEMPRYWMDASCSTILNANQAGTSPPLTDEICSATAGMLYRGDRNASWIGGPGQRQLFNSYFQPNHHNGDCGIGGVGRFKASSQHPGGVNMILGDCSVHFIKSHIELATWRAL